MAYHLRFWNWFLLACVGLLFGARNVAVGQNCTVTFFWPTDCSTCGGCSAYVNTGCSPFQDICSIYGVCSSGGSAQIDISYTKAMLGNGGDCIDMSGHQAGQSYTVYLTRAGCNNPGPTLATNYINCITWTNRTGVGRAYTFFQDVDPVNCGTNWVDYSAISGYVFAGGVISKCFTNRCPNQIRLYVAPYQGAPRDDYLSPEDAVTARGTNTVDQAVQAANGQTPIVNGLDGGQFNPGAAGGGAGTNAGPSTNLVRFFNLAPTNGIPGSGATSQDIYNLGDALIRAGQVNTDRIVGAIKAGSTNGSGNGEVVDAIQDFHRDATNGLAGVGAQVAAVGALLNTNGVLHRDLTNIDAALRGEGLGTNSFGDYGAALTGAGTAFGSAGYGTVTNAAGGYFGSGFTNGLGGSESGLLIDLAGSSSYPGSSLAKLDFRPSVWMSSLTVACVAIKALAGAFCAALLYIVIWRDMEERMRSLNSASQVTGRSLAGASIIGSTVGLTIKTALSTIITVGLAGLPTAVSAIGGGSFSVSFLEIAQSAAGGSGAGTLGSKMGTVWQWLGLMVPFGVILTACLNLWAWKVFAFAFETLWHIVFRLLPAFLVFYYVVTAEARDWIIDNRLPESVAILAGMDEGDDVMWYKPGVHLAPGLLDNLTVAYGVGTSNHIAIEPENTAEWVRVIISETYGVPYTAYVRIQYEHGFRWGFERGFILGCASVIIAGVVWFGRRTMSLGFGRYSE